MKVKYIFYISIILPLIFLNNCNNKNSRALENESISKAFIESWSMHDIEKLTSLFAENCLYEEIASGRTYHNKESIAGYAKSTLSGIPDSKFEIVNIAAGDTVSFVEWIWKGTNSVGWPSMGIPATNRYFELRGVSVLVIENNLIMKNSDYWDWNSFMQKIGSNETK